jgi:CheY-like chemotaxis protein
MSSFPRPPAADTDRYDVARTAFRAGFGKAAPTGPTALVVEDDYSSGLALTALLRRINLTVLTATSGYTALDILDERDEIAIVVMDIMMPVMDGYAAIAAIRRRSRLANLPIIAVTAKDVAGERERCLEAGASDFISKPVDSSTMLTAIATWIRPPDAAPTSW